MLACSKITNMALLHGIGNIFAKLSIASKEGLTLNNELQQHKSHANMTKRFIFYSLKMSLDNASKILGQVVTRLKVNPVQDREPIHFRFL